MLLDLKPILVTPGASLPFETREDLSDLVFGSCEARVRADSGQR